MAHFVPASIVNIRLRMFLWRRRHGSDQAAGQSKSNQAVEETKGPRFYTNLPKKKFKYFSNGFQLPVLFK